VEPIHESAQVLKQLSLLSADDDDLTGRLRAVGDLAVTLIPDCVGVTLTLIRQGQPFTVTATTDDLAVLDAVQYLDDGPCVTAAVSDAEVRVKDLLDEDRWQLFEAAAAAKGVRSSLSIPVRAGGATVGALNLYGGTPDAFSSRAAEVARLFGAQVGELVHNADLPFRTRETARMLPEQLEAQARVNRSLGVLMARNGWDVDTARQHLRDAAARAGVGAEDVAQVILHAVQDDTR
jgi:GAF domain-containing protein